MKKWFSFLLVTIVMSCTTEDEPDLVAFRSFGACQQEDWGSASARFGLLQSRSDSLFWSVVNAQAQVSLNIHWSCDKNEPIVKHKVVQDTLQLSFSSNRNWGANCSCPMEMTLAVADTTGIHVISAQGLYWNVYQK